MQLDIKDIVINKRVRQNAGDLSQLSESMEKYGQIHPIVVNKKNELISGYRRIQCAKKLKWQSVFAIVVDISSESDKLTMELEENLRRKDFTEEEKIEAFRKLAKMNKPCIITIIIKSIKDFLKKIFRIK